MNGWPGGSSAVAGDCQLTSMAALHLALMTGVLVARKHRRSVRLHRCCDAAVARPDGLGGIRPGPAPARPHRHYPASVAPGVMRRKLSVRAWICPLRIPADANISMMAVVRRWTGQSGRHIDYWVACGAIIAISNGRLWRMDATSTKLHSSRGAGRPVPRQTNRAVSGASMTSSIAFGVGSPRWWRRRRYGHAQRRAVPQ